MIGYEPFVQDTELRDTSNDWTIKLSIKKGSS